MNQQPIEKQIANLDGMVRVHSIFPTIQGEGPFAGRPATFIRLAGCNLQCPGCDTEYSGRSEMGIQELVATCEHNRHPLVVITGGEPFRQLILEGLVRRLLARGFEVQLETNGTLYVEGPWTREDVTIVCSPKTGLISESLRPYISAYKYVLDYMNVDPNDGLPSWTMKNPHGMAVARPPKGYTGRIYVQPLDEKDTLKNMKNQDACVASCLRYGYTLCVQIHKIVGVD